MGTLRLFVAACAVSVGLTSAAESAGQTRQTIDMRGHEQVLYLYGTPGGTPVIVSSGDGGWIHLGPHVAELLAPRGFFVIGFDARAYLESFTSAGTTVRVEDEPGDYRMLVDFAVRETGRKPILIGVSEGAGLSVLAATDAVNKKAIRGVIGLGLPDVTELGWRWRDMVIYLTHTTPHEPTFSVKAVVARMAPLPLAAIHSTGDEYVPLGEVHQTLECAREPKRLWTVDAADHRFSGNVGAFDRALIEAIAWIDGIRAGAGR